MLKRYLLFDINYYYPNGGMDDFSKDFDELEEVFDYLKSEHSAISLQRMKVEKMGDFNIYDQHERKIIWRHSENDLP